uniref:Pectate lyase B n=2 Tax=Colletotrichum gloeosporioides TaxID=474922 RepID=PLYB_COLGL|nr:RecName: Full=Pectate lyase B; Flags: Precursor [Colletotrichum gloeosporioides]AAD09857.1 pectate lyase B [Colletotrichum gloeosporioides]
MKFTGSPLLWPSWLPLPAPPPPLPSVTRRRDPRTVGKRAAITDACDVGYGAGTTGGSGGTTTTVSTPAQFTAAATSDEKAVIVVKGAITGATKVKVGSNKSIIGRAGSSLTGVGLYINKQENVIVRNMKISKVLADNGDRIGIQASSKVWVDHCDLSSDKKNNGKDYYDGLLDITHASMAVTVSNTYIHDHYKGSLVGHSDSNSAEDTGKLYVTYANNHWYNVASRNPSVRFGNVHIFNNYAEKLETSGVNTRMGAQLLIESSVFSDTKKAVTFLDSKSTGYAVVNDVDLGGSTNDRPQGTFTKPDYSYTLLGSSKVKAAVVGTAGQTLTF